MCVCSTSSLKLVFVGQHGCQCVDGRHCSFVLYNFVPFAIFMISFGKKLCQISTQAVQKQSLISGIYQAWRTSRTHFHSRSCSYTFDLVEWKNCSARRRSVCVDGLTGFPVTNKGTQTRGHLEGRSNWGVIGFEWKTVKPRWWRSATKKVLSLRSCWIFEATLVYWKCWTGCHLQSSGIECWV